MWRPSFVGLLRKLFIAFRRCKILNGFSQYHLKSRNLDQFFVFGTHKNDNLVGLVTSGCELFVAKFFLFVNFLRAPNAEMMTCRFKHSYDVMSFLSPKIVTETTGSFETQNLTAGFF